MITVLIERHIAPGMAITYEDFARKIIQATVTTPGFVSGESLRGLDDSNTRYIIVKMKSKEDWLHWLQSKTRREVVGLLDPLLTTPEKITVLGR